MSSCTEDYETEKQDIYTEDESSPETRFGVATISVYSNNSRGNQSAAIFGDYVCLVTDRLSTIHLYNIKTKSYLCKKTFEAKKDLTPGGYTLYHCNQMTFGVDYYTPDDPFPLIYISQRCRSDYRCFVEVYRIIPHKKDTENDYSSMDAQLVQTIYFPAMNYNNSMGNVNCTIDAKERLMYTYSRNNNKNEDNYGKCKISCFPIPNVSQNIVYLEGPDIQDSFMINCSAVNMQGGCINDGLLYIGQGFSSAGIYLNIVDLKKRKLIQRIDLLNDYGIKWEPEGCFYYNNNVMIAEGTNIWQIELTPLNK